MSKPWLVDRSRIVTRQKCPRKRFLGYDYAHPLYIGDFTEPSANAGLAKDEKPQPLTFGIVYHEGLSLLWKGGGIEEVVYTCREMLASQLDLEGRPSFFLREQQFLLECILRAWHMHRLPSLLADYELIETEVERAWDINGSGVVQMMRFDAILRHRRQDAIYVWDAKTVSRVDYSWVKQWEHDVQVLSYTQSAEELFGEPCEGVCIEGMIKGSYSLDDSASSPFYGERIQHSIYCYAYTKTMKAGAEKGQTRLLLKGETGAEKFAVYDHYTAPQWLAILEERGVLNEMFVVPPPFCPLPEHRERWKRQVVQAERQYEAGVRFIRSATSQEEMWSRMDLIVPQHDNACLAYGRACEFEAICFHGQDEDPEAFGYILREPHHDAEKGQS